MEYVRGDEMMSQRVAIVELISKMKCVYCESLFKQSTSVYADVLLELLELIHPKTNAWRYEDGEAIPKYMGHFCTRLGRFWEVISKISTMPYNSAIVVPLFKFIQRVHLRDVPFDIFEQCIEEFTRMDAL